MLRRTGCAMLTVFAAQVALAPVASVPAAAQSNETTESARGAPPTAGPQPAGVIEPAPSAIATAPQPPSPPSVAQPAAPPEPAAPATQSEPAPASAPASAANAPPEAAPPASAPPVAAEVPPPAPPVDPVIAEVRRQLAEPPKGNVDRGDRVALTTFYGERNEPPLWVSAGAFTAKANHLMAEIRRADDWGLSASAFELPHLASGTTAPEALAGAEIKLGLAALKYARHARGGRLDPALISRDIDVKLSFRDPKALLQSLAASDAPGNVLRDLNPKHEQFQKLRQALLKLRGGQASPEPAKIDARAAVRLPDGPPLYLGSEHPHVALLRQRLGLPLVRGAESIFDLEVQAALKAFQRQNGIQPTGILTPRTRSALNNSGVRPERPTVPPGSDAQRIIVNMERWRWLPEHLGDLHVEDNLPEFMTRVFKKGHVIHSAKIVVGKVDTPTAVFSANMRFVVFHPEWNVPDSIKVKELAPYLSGGGGGGFLFFGGGDTSILDRQRLRVVYNGRTVNPSSVDWGQVDIRRFTFVQSAGPHNVLGVVKFMFPNKHDIYMHDTPQRELFDQSRRTFSHGCMRVQNPERLAELVLAEDKGWSTEQVRELLAQGYNNEVQLTHEIPVHVTYFTAVAGEGGQVNYYGDIYGYDSRMAAALGGRPLPPEVVASSDEPPRDPRRVRPQRQSDFFSGLFGN